ncbi:hypothetical protein [Okeania sp. SIO2B3]|uniref:hypothetical protein n=1 Tax=Okeania sp. SIO2B3 TaxID=2607784 RepID=UPI0013C0680D|nr:hypothetical protein [Okeania sp. SIO2B3]NET47160.1 hypothetical protein [Okeania sp. SIO2B3]
MTGEKIPNQRIQEDISRTNEKTRKDRRNSNFLIGLSGINWILNDNFMWELVVNLMMLNPHQA